VAPLRTSATATAQKPSGSGGSVLLLVWASWRGTLRPTDRVSTQPGQVQRDRRRVVDAAQVVGEGFRIEEFALRKVVVVRVGSDHPLG
jgi:hypothetical protein